jgi:hypothetical protein
MKLDLQFGSDHVEYIWWQPIKEFHGLVIYRGKKWEFAMYGDDPTKKFDVICHFSEVRSYDPNWYATVYYDLDKEFYSKLACECGSDKHGFAGHADWCPKWIKL